MSIEPTSSFQQLSQQLAADLASRADDADQQGRLPAEDVRALIDSGYLTMSIPREYGGLGLSLRDCVAAHLEVAKGSASTALVAGMQIQTLGNLSENRPWDADKFERFCREAVHGLINSAASEPSLGSPSRGAFFETKAVQDGDCWLIEGHKTWVTGGKHLTHLLLRLDVDGEPGVIIVHNDLPGIEWAETWGGSLSLRASDSHDVYFKSVRVPLENLVERGKRDARIPNAWFPMIMACVYLGSALAARDTVIRYALERIPTALGKPIATLPKVQRQIGEIDIQLQAARTLLLEVAAAWPGDETGLAVYPRVAAAKHFATETANAVTEKALEIAGGASLTRGLPLERFFRDTRAGLMHPPSGDSALEIVGKGAIDSFQLPITTAET